MAELVSFPAHHAPAFQTVKAEYSCREIRELFGLSERTLRRWVQQGIVHPSDEDTLTFEFTSLPLFRKARELRAEGYSAQRIENEIRGQMNLFEHSPSNGGVIPFPRRVFLDAVDAQQRHDSRARALFLESI